MRTLEIITAEYNAAVAALRARQAELDAPVEGEEPPVEGQTRAYSVEQEAEIKTLLESAEALKKEMDDFVPPTVSDADRQDRQQRVQALLAVQTRAQQQGVQGAPQQIRSTGLTEQEGFYDDFITWAQTGVTADGRYTETYHLALPVLKEDEGERELEMRSLADGDLQTRAMSSSGASEAIPGQSVNRIVATLYESDLVRAAGATVITTDDGNDMSLPLLRRAAIPAGRFVTAESAANTAWDAVVAGPTLGSHVYRSETDIPLELTQDERGALLATLPSFLVDTLLSTRGADHTDGDGTDNASGLASYIGDNALDRVAIAAATNVTIPNVYALLDKLGTPYRARSVLMMHPTVWSLVRQLNASGNYIFQQNIDGKVPILNSEMDITYTDGDILILAFDPASYFIRDVRGVEVTRDPYIVGSNYQIRLRFASRGDGKYMKTNHANGTTNIAAWRGS